MIHDLKISMWTMLIYVNSNYNFDIEGYGLQEGLVTLGT